MFTPHVRDKVEEATAAVQRQVRNSQTVQTIERIPRFSTSRSRRFQIEYVDEMRKRRAGSEEHRLAAKTVLERHKQFCTVLMKGRTTEQIAHDCACWCRQVPSEVWCLDDQRTCSQRRVDRSET